MAIELELPTDIRKHEQKTIGPLTTKQFCYCIPAVLMGVGAWFLTKKIGGDTQLFATITAALPCLLLGFGKVYGLPLDKFIFSVGYSVAMGIIDPKTKRKTYQTENYFLPATEKNCKREELLANKKKPKKIKSSKVSKTFPQYQ